MPTDVQGETTKRAKAGLAKGAEDVIGKRAYGATFACHNGTGLQWKDLLLKINGFKKGNKAKVKLSGIDTKGKPDGTIGVQDQDVDANGEANFNFELTEKTIDANADFLVTVTHNPSDEKEVEYAVTMQPADENGFPIS